MADEVTDSSNHEQFVICLRWVDSISFAVNKDLVGFYQVDDITASTLFSSLKDVLLRLNINIQNCRAQCFDGASNMIGARSGVATLVQKEEPRAILVHCYGHSLQLAVCDTVKQIRIMSDALDTTNEISKLLKYSPKRDTF
ncbi:PREDICTED: zinc finger MYM-type protein 1-like [Amphimedon queenslandica]|nr:PREDICTED: zinc finger MYM-type protein 1-like [Amphimedon queenslandica]|eukprot:XP_003392082.2 PREDICTED: zinc finger MYM-type protein 1-like [Amphimedon queenslandica]